MSKLLDSPQTHTTQFRQLFHTEQYKDVIYYRTFQKLQYSFPTMEIMNEAQKEMSLIIWENDLKLRMTIQSGVLNHIVTIIPVA